MLHTWRDYDFHQLAVHNSQLSTSLAYNTHEYDYLWGTETKPITEYTMPPMCEVLPVVPAAPLPTKLPMFQCQAWAFTGLCNDIQQPLLLIVLAVSHIPDSRSRMFSIPKRGTFVNLLSCTIWSKWWSLSLVVVVSNTGCLYSLDMNILEIVMGRILDRLGNEPPLTFA